MLENWVGKEYGGVTVLSVEGTNVVYQGPKKIERKPFWYLSRYYDDSKNVPEGNEFDTVDVRAMSAETFDQVVSTFTSKFGTIIAATNLGLSITTKSLQAVEERLTNSGYQKVYGTWAKEVKKSKTSFPSFRISAMEIWPK